MAATGANRTRAARAREVESVQSAGERKSDGVVRSRDPVPLFDLEGNPWAFTDGITYTFPADLTLPADGRLMLVKMRKEDAEQTFARVLSSNPSKRKEIIDSSILIF